MHNLSQIETHSYWKKHLLHDYHTCESDTLVITLPGYSYSADKPLFYYLMGAYLQKGHDILKVRYGFQLAQVDINFNEDILRLKDEIIKLVKQFEYKHYIIIGKSMGTVFMPFIKEELVYETIKTIYLTPTNSTMPDVISPDATFVYGQADGKLSDDQRKRLDNHHHLVIAKGNHKLITGDVFNDLVEMKNIIKHVITFTEDEQS